MGRYQLGDHVWSIERGDHKLVIKEPDGLERIEPFADAESTARRFTILVNQKLRAGWKLAVEVPVPDALPAQPMVFDARSPELEAAVIAASMDDPAPWLVYGDWLQQQGDPRGEHIALRAAAMATPTDPLAPARLRAFEDLHRAYLTGGIRDCVVGWGFVGEIHFFEHARDARVLRNAASRLVRHLRISLPSARMAALLPKIATYELVALRSLAIAGAEIPALAPLSRALTQVERLALRGSMSADAAATLAALALPALRGLAIALDDDQAPVLEPLLARPLSLRSLELDAEASETLCAWIVESPNATTLEELTLPQLDDAGAKVLLAGIERFPRLRSLGVSKQVRGRTWRALADRIPDVVRADGSDYQDEQDRREAADNEVM